MKHRHIEKITGKFAGWSATVLLFSAAVWLPVQYVSGRPGSEALAFKSQETPLLAAEIAPQIALDVTSKSGQTSTKSASTIASEILQAYGGIDKIKEFDNASVHSHSKVTATSGLSDASNSMDCNQYEKGDKMRMETVIAGQKEIMAYDGKMYWKQIDDWVSPCTKTIAKAADDEIVHGAKCLEHLGDPSCKIELSGQKPVQGKLCDVLIVTSPKEDKPTTLYADAQSHLALRTEFLGQDSEQGIPAVLGTEYSDYRPTAGTQVPYRIDEYTGSRKKAFGTLESMEIGIPIDDKLFVMPPESEIAEVRDTPVTIPFELIGNEIVITARVNRQRDLKFVLDTGVSITVLDKSIAQQLGDVKSGGLSVTAGAKSVDTGYIQLSSLSLGRANINDMTALVTDLSVLSQLLGEHPAGLIGGDLLRKFLVTIDFETKTITLANPKNNLEAGAGTYVVPTIPVFGGTTQVVRGKLNDKVEANFLVDTGATFCNLPNVIAKKVIGGAILPVTSVQGVDKNPTRVGAVKLNSLTLDKLDIHQPVFTVMPDGGSGAGPVGGFITASGMGILGNTVWTNYSTTFDYRNERLLITPLPATRALDQYGAQLAKADMDMLSKNDYNKGISAFTAIANETQQNDLKAVQAVATLGVAKCYVERFIKQGNSLDLTQAVRTLTLTEQSARAAHDTAVEADVLAWLGYTTVLGADQPQALAPAQSYLTQAAKLDSAGSDVFMAMSALLFKVGQVDPGNKMLDQALLMQPDNWRGLWMRYNMNVKQGNVAGAQQVQAELNKYYPQCEDVLALKRAAGAKLTSGVRQAGSAKQAATAKKAKLGGHH